MRRIRSRPARLGGIASDGDEVNMQQTAHSIWNWDTNLEPFHVLQLVKGFMVEPMTIARPSGLTPFGHQLHEHLRGECPIAACRARVVMDVTARLPVKCRQESGA